MEVRIDQSEKRSWLEINLAQIRRNYKIFKKNIPDKTLVIAVIKADAYGHGDSIIANALTGLGVNFFAVSNIDEAVGLRNAGILCDILILGYSSPIYAKQLAALDLTQTIVSEEYAEALVATGYKIKCHFAIDTGMNRIGINSNSLEASSIIRKYANKLNVQGIFTHLCVADSEDPADIEFTQNQLNTFKIVADSISNLKLSYIHCLNSAGGLRYINQSNIHDSIGKIVRLGIVLYGLKPDSSVALPKGIKPAITWKSVISMGRTVKKGETVGYGRTYVAERDSIIATVTTGYADGYNRKLSNKGFILINGHKAPIVGRICMDQTLIDVTDVPEVRMGDIVILLGESKGFHYDADDMAKDLDTIGYEIMCGISKRVQRFYI